MLSFVLSCLGYVIIDFLYHVDLEALSQGVECFILNTCLQ